MTKERLSVENIMAIILGPGFGLIKDYIMSKGHGGLEVNSKQDGLEISFVDACGRKCAYSRWGDENGRIYGRWDKPPDHEVDIAGREASEVTAQTILDDFLAVFRLVL